MRKIQNARITVYQNEVLIHDDFPIKRKTGAGRKEGPEALPIKFQGHHNEVRFRDVWIQTLSLDDADNSNASENASDTSFRKHRE